MSHSYIVKYPIKRTAEESRLVGLMATARSCAGMARAILMEHRAFRGLPRLTEDCDPRLEREAFEALSGPRRELLSQLNSTIVLLDPRYYMHLGHAQRQGLEPQAKTEGRNYERIHNGRERQRRERSRRLQLIRRTKYADLTAEKARTVLDYATKEHGMFVSSDTGSLDDNDVIIIAQSVLELSQDKFKVQDALDWKEAA